MSVAAMDMARVLPLNQVELMPIMASSPTFVTQEWLAETVNTDQDNFAKSDD